MLARLIDPGLNLWDIGQALKTPFWIILSLVLHGTLAVCLWRMGPGIPAPSHPDEEIVDLTLAAPPQGNSSEIASAPRAPVEKPQAAAILPTTETTETPTTAESSNPPGGSANTEGGTGGGDNPTAWGEVTRLPKVLHEIKATYPAEAKKAGVAGPVVLDILIDSTGKVRDVQLISGPGFGLNESAMEALKKFEFRPALKGDTSVAVKIRYTYRFKLDVN